MKVSFWAEVRRLHEVEGLSQRAIATKVGCCRETVRQALKMSQPPNERVGTKRGSILDPYKEKIDALVAQSPDLSAVRVTEEIGRGPDGYRGSVILVRRYLRKIRPARGRVYQEVTWEPGQAIQVDWGHCGTVKIDGTSRKVSVLVVVLCYSRLCYIEFTLSQKKAEFYRAIRHALEFYGGSPRQIIFDNLKAAVLNGSGRNACLHPEFLALCGHYYLEPIACQRRDPESKGIVEAGVRYVKYNALQGRELTCWDDYQQLAVTWRDEVANMRIHKATGQRPVDRFQEEQLRALSSVCFDTDELVPTVVTSHARISFDGNRYSVPPEYVRKPVTIRADANRVRIIYEGREAACHNRCYARGQLVRQDEHHLQALLLRKRNQANYRANAFDELGDVARQFHLKLLTRPIKATHHIRRLMGLVNTYGQADVLASIARALEYQTYDAAYVETILLQERRRRELPSPTPLRPQRQELIDEIHVEPSDPAVYDRLFGLSDLDENQKDESLTDQDPKTEQEP
jgi:transposase